MSVLDLILWSNTKAALLTWGKTTPPNRPLIGADNEPVEGVRYSWWADSGKLLTGRDPDTFLTGFVCILRLHSSYFDADKLADSGEQEARSAVVKYIKDNGTPGSMASGALPYYELNGVRIFRPQDVEDWLLARGLPNHIWVGGNSY